MITENSIIIPPPIDMRIRAFAELGKIMKIASSSFSSPESDFVKKFPSFVDALRNATFHNPWFTPYNIRLSLSNWGELLIEDSISAWVKPYLSGIQDINTKKVAVIMAGNIPLVGFHDFLSVLIAGHQVIGKLSSTDKILLPAIADLLCKIESRFSPMIQFTENKIENFDAIIATGSNNTARYFEYYFSKYPHIIRKNRNGIAVLTGDEDDAALNRLGDDICSYFGLGCRNVSKVFIPMGYAPEKIFVAIEPYINTLNNHNKYMNNYSYQRSILLLNKTHHLDNGVFILTESEKYTSPIPVLFYEFYSDIVLLKRKLLRDDEFIQCIANDIFTSGNTVLLGHTQSPELYEYADGIDTMKFLIDL